MQTFSESLKEVHEVGLLLGTLEYEQRGTEATWVCFMEIKDGWPTGFCSIGKGNTPTEAIEAALREATSNKDKWPKPQGNEPTPNQVLENF